MGNRRQVDRCNFIFIDHRADEHIVNRLLFYHGAFPGRRIGLVLNRAEPLALPPELRDVSVLKIPDGSALPAGSYQAAALWAVPSVAEIAASRTFRAHPSIMMECDLQICRPDIEARVHELAPSRDGLRYGMCCFNSKPPTGDEFHAGDPNICNLHREAFGTDYPIAATGLAATAITGAGARAFLHLSKRPAARRYFDYLVDQAAASLRGKRVGYAVLYYTDYMFPSACKLAGLQLADSINKIIPRRPNQCADIADANSEADVLEMLDDDRFYCIHHLSTENERFPGAAQCTMLVKQQLMERIHGRTARARY